MQHHGTFGQDAFGRGAEHAARFFGTPQYILGQTVMVILWIAINSVGLALHWDPYPFILLNLAFSTQAAYAAPLILLAQTRQAERDKLAVDKAELRHEEVERRHDKAERRAGHRIAALKAETEKLRRLLQSNTELTRQDKELTEQVAGLTREIHEALIRRG
jgi:uncharacterized membrane protein